MLMGNMGLVMIPLFATMKVVDLSLTTMEEIQVNAPCPINVFALMAIIQVWMVTSKSAARIIMW